VLNFFIFASLAIALLVDMVLAPSIRPIFIDMLPMPLVGAYGFSDDLVQWLKRRK
jgi:hypothetical protein